MVKTIRCADLDLDCNYEVKAENENEALKRISGHVRTVHAMNPDLPEIDEKLRRAMREE